MKLVSLKSDGRKHRIWTDVEKTIVPNAYRIPPHTPVVEGDGSRWSSDYDVVAFFWPKAFFQVFMLLKPHETAYYCNVITPAVRTTEEITFVDLDLDVLVATDGVRLLDEAEFKARTHLYPKDWQAGAIEGAHWLMEAVQSHWGPFRPATANWWRAFMTSQSGQGVKH